MSNQAQKNADEKCDHDVLMKHGRCRIESRQTQNGNDLEHDDFFVMGMRLKCRCWEILINSPLVVDGFSVNYLSR